MEDPIEIPENVLIRCPKVQFNLARVSACAACASFAGLVDRFPNGDMPFARRYLVQCSAEPVNRELFELSGGGK